MDTIKTKWISGRVVLILILMMVGIGFTHSKTHKQQAFLSINHSPVDKISLYEKLGLKALGLTKEAFNYAISGFTTLLNTGKIKNENILSILDFSLPSCKKRLFVIDLLNEELVFNTYASHGKNSGNIVPTLFSNQNNSKKSSLGFYITGSTYNGKKGCSLRLEGEEAGINNNALGRGIVMHGAAYVNESLANKQGFVGRSQGCPALPKTESKKVIDKIKNGSCLFIYSHDAYYISHSRLITGAA